MSYESNFTRFMLLMRILVDETTEKEPLTKYQLMRRCEDFGCYLNPNTFDKYIKDMAECGIIIKRRLATGKHRGEFFLLVRRRLDLSGQMRARAVYEQTEILVVRKRPACDSQLPGTPGGQG